MKGILVLSFLCYQVLAFRPSALASRGISSTRNRHILMPLLPIKQSHDTDISSRPSARLSSFSSLGLFRFTSSKPEKVVKVLRKGTLGGMKKWIRRALAAALMFCLVHFTSIHSAWAGGSGGRMGGSFKPSTRSSFSRPRSYSAPRSPPRPIRVYSNYRPPPRIIINNRAPVRAFSDAAQKEGFLGSTPVVQKSRVSTSDIILWTGTGALITYNVMKKDRGGRGGSGSTTLGPGVSVISLTVSLNVPDRDDPNSVLSKLARQSLTARTDTRKGVQDMITETSLELLRQEKSIISVDSAYTHFRSFTEAEREFNRVSINKRSKFDRESVSNFAGEKIEKAPSQGDGNFLLRSTAAVVSLTVCIEGDSTKIPKIKNRIELREALSKVASDAQVDECLLSAEVLWTPEDKLDTLSTEELIADYPSLYPLLD